MDVNVLHRIEGDVAHFQTLTFWTSEESIKDFTGNEVLKAKYYPEDEDFPLKFEEYVRHYQVTKN